MRIQPLLLLLLAGCGANTPVGVAQRYARAAGTGDEHAIARWIDPRCAGAPIGHGAPFRMLGQPLEIKSLDLELIEQDEDRAKVRYTFDGKLESEGGEHELKLLGKDVTITTGEIEAEFDEVTGDLRLLRLDGTWKVTCTAPALR